MADKVRRAALWTALCALTALSVWGLHSARLLDQTVWQPEGVRRFLTFAAVYWTWFLLVDRFRPRWFPALTAAAVLAYTTLATGPYAVAAVLYYLGSALALGRLLFRKVEEPAVAAVAGMGVYVFAAGLAAHLPVNYPAVHAAVLAVPLIAALRARVTVRAAEAETPAFAARAARGLAVFLLLAHWLVSLKPEVGADALAMHLALPAWVTQHHSWPFNFHHLVWSVMPLNADWAFTTVFLLGGEYAARLLNFCLLAAAAVLLYSASRMWLAAGAAWLVVALFLSTPLAQLLTGSLFAENFWAAMLLAAATAVWRYRATGARAYLAAAAIAAGTAAASKYAAAPFALTLACFGAAEAVRRKHGRAGWAALAGLLLFAAPPYVTALVKTGNPVYPFLNAVFRSPYFDSSTSFSDPRFQSSAHWTLPYDVTFHSSRYLEGQDGALGFHYLLLLPLVLPALGRRWPYAGWVAGVTAAVGAGAAFAFQPNLRYVYPALPLCLAALSAAFGKLQSLDVPFYRVVLGASLAALGLNVWFLPSAGWSHKDFVWLMPQGRECAEKYIAAGAPARPLVEYLNRTHPGSPAAFFEANQIAGLQGAPYANHWHSDAFLRRLRAAASPEDCRRLMLDLGVRHFIVPAPGRGRAPLEVQAEQFLAAYTEPEYSSGTYYVARLREDARLPGAPAPAPEGRYDDLDPHLVFRGPWLRGRDFPQASGGGVTYSDTPGAGFTFAFTGREITWVYTAAHNRGAAEVSIDGRPRERVDLYSQAVRWQVSKTFGGLEPGAHEFTVRVLPERNNASSGGYADVDAIVVR